MEFTGKFANPLQVRINAWPIHGITAIAAGFIDAVLSFMQNQYYLILKRRWDKSPFIQIDSDLPFTTKCCDGLARRV